MNEPTSAKSAAHLWRARHNEGLTAIERLEFDQWLASDQAHREAFLESEVLWEALSQVDFSDANPTATIAPGTLSEGPSTRLRTLFEPLLDWGGQAIAATVAIVLVGSVVFLAIQSDFGGDDAAGAITRYATSARQSQQINLPDGSRILLDASSILEVDYSDGLRRAKLTLGSALFDVAKDSERPFVVGSKYAQVIVTGTNFATALRDSGLEVKVREGSVDVVPADLDPGTIERSMRYSLAAGEAIWTDDGREVLPLERSSAPTLVNQSTSPVRTTATAMRLEPRTYRSAPLSQIVADLNGAPGVSIRLDPAAAGLTISGTFQGDDPASILATIEAALPVTISETQGQIIITRN
ncbi:MAG: FecR domain-containing protein [Pseudomonadota bacterium]